ncbi:MAG: glycosyltransferase family 4 protein [Thermodesulfobacteriota bacterium]
MKYNPFGGYERQAALLAEALAARGDRVTVFTGEWKGPWRPGITVEKVPVVRLASWLKVLSFAYFSRRRILGARARFDVVVAFDRTLVADIYRAGNACHREWEAFRSANEGLGGRLSMAINPLGRVINGIERRLFSTIARERGRIVVLSETGMRQIRRHYDVDPDRFVVIPPAVDFSRFDDAGATASRAGVREELGAGVDTLVVLHVGSGFKIKGLRSTVESMAVLKARGVDALLVVAGRDARATARLRRLADRLGIGGRVRFLGGVKDVARLYSASDVFCVPSLFETFGVAAVEALYAGLPVIVGKGAGVASAIEEWNAAGEAAGTVVDVPARADALADAIERTWKEEARFRAHGGLEDRRRGRRALASRCGHDAVMEKFVSLIDETAGSGTN